jgi:phosphoribosylformylglycinamidine (FGAM) synthase-like enzyme
MIRGIPEVPTARKLYQRCTRLSRRAGAACHDLSEGGLAVAAAEMCIGGRLGLESTWTGHSPAPLLACLAKPTAACWWKLRPEQAQLSSALARAAAAAAWAGNAEARSLSIHHPFAWAGHALAAGGASWSPPGRLRANRRKANEAFA